MRSRIDWKGRGWAAAVLLVLLAVGCAGPGKGKVAEEEVAPREGGGGIRKAGRFGLPSFSDDLSPAGLEEAVRKSLEYYAGLDPDSPVDFGKDRYRVKDLQRSLQDFLGWVRGGLGSAEKKKAIRKAFRIYQGGGSKGEVLFTGYYEPSLPGCRLPGLECMVPIYGVPRDLVTVDLGLFRRDLKGMRIVGRYRGGRLVPYYSRHEIDRLGVLKGKGYEIAWVRDPVEAFFLHVQGSGRILLPDGEVLHVHYAASNGRPYRGIGNLLVRAGKIRKEEKSLWALKRYLKSRPGERDRLMDYNESYVFFEVVSDGPIGSLGVRLTPGRSLALDPAYYPRGALAYIETEVPVLGDDDRPVSWKRVGRFVLVQDAGGAIKGPARADLFWGHGDKAGAEAGWMNRPGKLYFLAPKEAR